MKNYFYQFLTNQPIGQDGLALQPSGPKFNSLKEAREAKKRLTVRKESWDRLILDGKIISQYFTGEPSNVLIQKFYL